jgi:ABC-type nitrate/sulfonate/bicarbonate transport system permease component
MSRRRRLIEVANPVGWLVVVVAICLWQLLIQTKVVEFNYISSPSEIVQGFSDLASSGDMGRALVHTLVVTVVASAIGMVLGVVYGSLLGLVDGVRSFSMGSVDVLRTVPVVALMPVALLVWGASAKSEIIVASYSAMWPIMINTAAGVRNVHPVKRDVARTFRLSRADSIRKIVFPVATPAILVGARLSVVNALVVAIVAEMVINPQGIGYGLVFAQQSLHPDQMWAYAVVAGIVGYLLNSLLVQVVRRGGANMGVQQS